MKDQKVLNLLQDLDFRLDATGRMIIENEELLSVVNGAMSLSSLFEMVSTNTTCGNVSC